MLDSSSQPATLPTSSDTPLDSCEAIVFQNQGYQFALPLAAVLRIVQRSAIALSQNPIDLEHRHSSYPILLFENQPIRLIDISRHLLQPGLSESDRPLSPKLGSVHLLVMIAQTRNGELIGIPMSHPPEVIKLPLQEIMLLPPFYRSQIANLASHAVLMPCAEQPLILLLDLQALL